MVIEKWYINSLEGQFLAKWKCGRDVAKGLGLNYNARMCQKSLTDGGKTGEHYGFLWSDEPLNEEDAIIN